MFYFIDASRVLQGHLQLYFPTNFGHEPLFIYAEAAMIWLGVHAFALRYTAVIGGMLSMAIGYALARRLFGKRTALVTTALFAALFWPVFITRVGLRAFTYPLLSMFSIYALWRALQERSWGWTVAAAIFNGLILYTYLASRVFPLVILLWLLALLVLDRRRWWICAPAPRRGQQTHVHHGRSLLPDSAWRLPGADGECRKSARYGHRARRTGRALQCRRTSHI